MVPATFTDHVFAPFEGASSNHLLCGQYLISRRDKGTFIWRPGRAHTNRCENSALAYHPDSASCIRAVIDSGFAALFMPMSADNVARIASAESGKSRLKLATLIT